MAAAGEGGRQVEMVGRVVGREGWEKEGEWKV